MNSHSLDRTRNRKQALGYALLSLLAVLTVALGCHYCSRKAMLFTGQTGNVTETLLVKADTVLSVQQLYGHRDLRRAQGRLRRCRADL